jgi:hypothetical protein
LAIVGIVALSLGVGSAVLARRVVAALAPDPPPYEPVIDGRHPSEFSRYPLFWLGEEFEGLPLVGIHRPRTNFVSFRYGRCKLHRGSCATPLIVSVQPHCAAETAGEPSTIEIRETDWLVLGRGAGIRLEHMDFTVSVVASPDRVMRAAEALEGVNALALGIGPGEPLDGCFPRGTAC